MTTTHPSAAVDRAWNVFPAGGNGEFNLPRDRSVVLAGGEGCRVWDSEGRTYLDFSMGWGSALPGHAARHVIDAAARQAAHGTNFATVTLPALELAEELVRLSPACEQVRFCASGTEATLYCQRLARAHTGRPALLKFENAYHGANDLGVASLFPGAWPPHPQPEACSAGTTPNALADILVAPFNDTEATCAIVRDHADRLAAVVVEPLHRCLPPAPGFLEALRAVCHDTGVLLVFDEVVTGFRLAYGGAQERYGVVPDLVAYGKALGGGYPIGAYGGRADIMALACEDRLHRDTYVWTASTTGGNPVSAAAALAALSGYREPGFHEKLFALGDAFRRGLRSVASAAGAEVCVVGDGPLAQVLFTPGPVTSYRALPPDASRKGRAFMLALLGEGIFLNPMGTKLYLSAAHDDATCENFLRAARTAFAAT